jgi:nucleoside-triphosphatase THEP1
MIIIDEVGALELENKGWANSITNFSNSSSSHLIISVRDTVVEQVIEKWKFRNYSIFKAYQSDFLAVSNKIAEEISNRNR